MGLFRAAAAAAILSTTTVLGQSSSQAGNGASGGTSCGAGNNCPSNIPCCSREASIRCEVAVDAINANVHMQNTGLAAWELTASAAAIPNTPSPSSLVCLRQYARLQITG